MGNKLIVYTSNLGFTPKTLADVIAFAKQNCKFRIAECGLNDYLASVKVGDNLITKKGNSLYVIRTFDKSIDELSGEDRAYIDDLARNYDVKKVNITSVANRIKFETWCREARPLLNTESASTSKTTNMNSIKNLGERLKANLIPTEAKDVRVAMDGNICVATANGYVTIDENFRLTSYPDEFVVNIPAYTLPKPVDQLKVGDIIAREKSYAKVKAIKDGRITVVGYTGAGSNVYPIKDFFLGQTTVRVVVSLAGNLGGQMNPLMLLALSDKKDNDSLLPLMLLSQNGGALQANPMMMMALAGGDKFDIKDLLVYSALGGGQNPFGNLFGAAAPVAAAPAAATPVAATPVVAPVETTEPSDE